MQVRPIKSTSIENNISFFNEAKPLELLETEAEGEMSTRCWMGQLVRGSVLHRVGLA